MLCSVPRGCTQQQSQLRQEHANLECYEVPACVRSAQQHLFWPLPLQVDPSRVRCGYKCRGYTEDAAAGMVAVHFKDQPDIQ
jgi:hypothetical protein